MTTERLVQRTTPRKHLIEVKKKKMFFTPTISTWNLWTSSILGVEPSKTRPKLQAKQGAPFGFQVGWFRPLNRWVITPTIPITIVTVAITSMGPPTPNRRCYIQVSILRKIRVGEIVGRVTSPILRSLFSGWFVGLNPVLSEQHHYNILNGDGHPIYLYTKNEFHP